MKNSICFGLGWLAQIWLSHPGRAQLNPSLLDINVVKNFEVNLLISTSLLANQCQAGTYNYFVHNTIQYTDH